MFIDETEIQVSSGAGGDGIVSFRREKYIPLGGPDGGDGGKGGDIVLVVDRSLDTLLGVTSSPHFFADNGRPGKGRSMSGADADIVIVPLPPGTLVFDKDSGEQLADVGAGELAVLEDHTGDSLAGLVRRQPRESVEQLLQSFGREIDLGAGAFAQ